MEKEFYNCKYCFKEFEPKRRRVQKFCSDSCRSKNHHEKNSAKKLSEPEIAQNDKPTANKAEKMSLSGVGDATAGTLVADGIKYLATPAQKRNATKADIAYLASKIKRYHKIVNLPPNEQRKTPYFDLETNKVIYSFCHLTDNRKISTRFLHLFYAYLI